MKEFKITFLKEQYKTDSPFSVGSESYITSASITKNINGEIEIFHVRLDDIGLHSIYGEFDLLCKNSMWLFNENDSREFNLLKKNIVNELMNI